MICKIYVDVISNNRQRIIPKQNGLYRNIQSGHPDFRTCLEVYSYRLRTEYWQPTDRDVWKIGLYWHAVPLNYCCDEVRLRLIGTGPLEGPLSILLMMHGWIWSSSRKILMEKKNQRTRTEMCSSVTLFAASTAWGDPCANPGLPLWKPATNRISTDTVISRP
jgi:hypothetical protein